MAKTESEKAPAQKVITITDLNAAIAELDNADQIREAVESGLVKAEIDLVEVDDRKYSGDYVRLTVGPNAQTDEDVVRALVVISGGNLRAPKKEGSDEPDNRAPNMEKFTIYGSDLAARSRVSQQIKAKAEGPDKAIEQMAKLLVKNKPGTSLEQAREMAKALLSDE